MSLLFSHAASVRRTHATDDSRRGVILLVVLGMLTLFSILAVSYLVFTTRQRTASFNITRAEIARIDSESLVRGALKEIVVGSDGPQSSLWGHSILADLYGMRDGVIGDVMPAVSYSSASLDMAPEVLLNGQFLRFPSTLHLTAEYPFRRNDNEVDRRYPVYTGPYNSGPTTTSFPMDDSLNGRLLTFTDGPLADLTMPIVRYFGEHRAATNARSQLSGQVILDLREHLESRVEIDGDTLTLAQWLALPGFSPHRLFYDQIVTAGSTTPTPYSNYYINGRVLNGPGLGWDLTRNQFNNTTGNTFNQNDVVAASLNITSLMNAIRNGTPFTPDHVPVTGGAYDASGSDVPIAMQGHYALHRFASNDATGNALESFLQDLPPGDVDEPYDAADYNNLWLSYFPNSDLLGRPTPSFVRPALLNWVINQESVALQTLPVQRLRNILYAIQRTTLRPLPYANDPNVPVSPADRGDGVLKLRYANASATAPLVFTGSNDAPGLKDPIDISSTDPVYLANAIRLLARALAGRDTDGDGILDSWDVDNNGDGVRDSVWTDAGSPLIQTPTGKLIKPLVAYMVEDLGGRVNVNLTGNLAQARDVIGTSMQGSLQHGAPIRTPASDYRKSPAPVPTGLPAPNPTMGEVVVTDLPTGFGYGPAEIDVRALFTAAGSLGTTADRYRRGPQRLLCERLGVWSSADGKMSPVTPLTGGIYVAAGDLLDPLSGGGNDILGALRYPGRANLQRLAGSQGLPTDAFGRSSVGLGVDGGMLVARAALPVNNAGLMAGDSLDDPYEFQMDAFGEPDAPYTLADMEGLLRFEDFDRELLASRLVTLINEYHDDINGTQPDTLARIRRALAESITTHSNSAVLPTGVLPSEWRPRPDLTNYNTIPIVRQKTATGALPPQTLFRLGFAAAEPRRSDYPTNNDFLIALRSYHTALNGVLWELMPFEARSGQRMNLNRPFGNQLDDDGDGVIDDPDEIALHVNGREDDGDMPANPDDLGEYVDRPLKYASGLPTSPFTHWTSSRGDVTPLEPGVESRQLFARHLYVLVMFLIRDSNASNDFEFPNNITGPLPTSRQRQDPPGSSNWVTVDPQDEYRAWKVAQWAINVADFRDTDAIMSRFDYDVYPYDGWDIVNSGPNNTFRTVWGLEYPELTLEESLAFHDRKVRDTDLDDGSGTKSLIGPGGNASGGVDRDPDQWRLPEGSAFFEIRSTRSPQPLRVPGSETSADSNAWSYPSELYFNRGTVTNPDWVLDLARQAPDRNPVWRIAITTAHDDPNRPAEAELCPDFALKPSGSGAEGAPPAINRDTTTLNPLQPDFFGPPNAVDVIDRVVWFANEDPDSNDDGIVDGWVANDSAAPGKIFYNRSANRYLDNGQFAVIGPRIITALGSLETHSVAGPTHDPTTDEVIVDAVDYESPQRISMAGTVEHTNLNGSSTRPTMDPAAGGSIRNPLPIIAMSNPPTAWGGANTRNRTIGLNVSEPYEIVGGHPSLPARSYYREPVERLNDRQVGTPDEFPIDTWYNTETGNGPGLPDRPFDTEAYAELEQVFGNNGQRTGTRTHFKTAYLQRLADPTLPHDPNTNPYISVDYIAIDLTVFNGSMDNSESKNDSMGVALWPDRNDRNPYGSGPDERFASRFKTGQPLHEDSASGTYANLTHSVNTMMPETTSVGGAGAHDPHFQINLNVAADANTGGYDRTAHSTTLGYLNHTFGERWAQEAGGARASISPFIGLPFDTWRSNILWLNRDFVSAEELMWVPTAGPGRLAVDFGSATGLTGTDQFDDANNELAGPPTPTSASRYDFNQRFTHLWNYFSSNSNDFDTAGAASPNFWRLLDWVEVPPPFDADADFVSPESDVMQLGEQSNFTTNFIYPTFSPAATQIDGNPTSWTHPGQTDMVWNSGAGRWQNVAPGSGATNGFWTNHVAVEPFRPPHSFRSGLFRSGLINLNTIKNDRVYQALMHGFSTSGERPGAGNGAFWNAFLDSRRGFTLPATTGTESLHSNFDQSMPTQFAGVFQSPHGTDIAPLASMRSDASRNSPINGSILRPDTSTPARPLLQRDPTTVPAAQSHERSVVHQQLGVTRTSNLAAGQSNVYAIWITVGLFEVDSQTLTVGQELGYDTGSVKRYKGFFIIDRSKPVMFEPGKENNFNNVVQLSRILN